MHCAVPQHPILHSSLPVPLPPFAVLLQPDPSSPAPQAAGTSSTGGAVVNAAGGNTAGTKPNQQVPGNGATSSAATDALDATNSSPTATSGGNAPRPSGNA